MTPLHQAILDNDLAAVTRLKNSEWLDSYEKLGYTPAELAHLLGRKSCQQILQDSSAVQLTVAPPHSPPRLYSQDELEDFLGIAFHSSLLFSSYEQLVEVAGLCPYLLRSQWLAEENHAWGQRYRQLQHKGPAVPLSIRWIDQEMGYGLYADEDLPAGTCIGEYAGLVRSLSAGSLPQNAYCLHYPTKWRSKNFWVVDAQRSGSSTRFINHSASPNLTTVCAVDRSLLHQLFITAQSISKGTQLTCDYGEDYWRRRKPLANTDKKSKFTEALEKSKQAPFPPTAQE